MKQAVEKIRTVLSPLYSTTEIECYKRIIFEHIKGWSAVDIIMHKDTILSDSERNAVEEIVRELSTLKPIQYILGYTEFYGHRFEVNEHTLIPRPETAELVDMIVREVGVSGVKILDVGTGSGCIAVSLNLLIEGSKVDAVDISDGALDMAMRNATANHAEVCFSIADALHMDAPLLPLYDIIVSNPPYICDAERSDMDTTVTDFEPATALFVPDSDPLLFYREIAKYGMHALKYNGRLYFEINNRYAERMNIMLQDLGYADVRIVNDIHGLPRFACAIKLIK